MVFLNQGSPTPLHRIKVSSSQAWPSPRPRYDFSHPFPPFSRTLWEGLFTSFQKYSSKGQQVEDPLLDETSIQWNYSLLTLIYYSNLILWNIDYVKLFTIKIFLVSNETLVQQNRSLSPSWSIDLEKFTIYYYYSSI